jgi:hypothetical protein
MDFRNWIDHPAKPWKASKKQILNFWSKLPENMPLVADKPIPSRYQGQTYSYDGMRITGTSQFINSIMSKIKDIVKFDDNNTKLNLIYRQQVDKNTDYPLPNSFVFYVQVRERTKGKK